MNTKHVLITSAVLAVATTLIASAPRVLAARYDSSGSNGSNGSSGGYAGGHAGRSSPGTDGGDITLTLNDFDRSGRALMQVVGTVGGRGVQDTLDLNPNVMINLTANGGKGGDGGRGGDGTNGSTGSRGSDATRSSRGTDGGRGGDGGPGGDGTPGSNGGNGGRIVVKLAAEDMHLALLVSHEASGGGAGAAGSNGRGGSGGSGGAGGSSYSETVQTSETCKDSFSSNGNGSSTVTRSCDPVYTTYSNSGGSYGSRGFDGRSGSGNVSAGSRGQDGSFQFLVTGPGGTTTYRQAMNLQMTSFQFRESNVNGVFEPGETVEVTGIRIENRSDMPWMPGKANALLTLSSTNWVISEPIEIDVPALGAGQATTLQKVFRFKIRDNKLPVSEERLAVSETIVPLGRITRVERTPRGLQLPKTLVISYPVEITPISTKRSAVKPGETIDIMWSVKNLSTKPVGIDSEEARELITSIRKWRPTKGEESPGGVSFDGNDTNSTFAQSVALLAPGASFAVKGKLTFDNEHLPYTDVAIQTGLSMKTIETANATREIQLRTFRFSIAQTFAGHKDAEWLIVTNGGTKREEYLGWLALARRLGKKIDVWDLSYQGDLSLFKTLAESGTTLSNLYAGKTVIVLNNKFLHNSRRAESRNLMASADVIRTLGEHGTRFYFVGGDEVASEALVRSLLTRSDRPDQDEHEYSYDEMLKRVESASALESGVHYRVQVSEKFFRRPDRSAFEARIRKLREVVAKRYPDQRFVVSGKSIQPRAYNDDFFALYDLGTIDLIPSISRSATGSITWLPRDERESQSPAFIATPENFKAVVLASNTSQKYGILKTLAKNSDEDADIAIHGLVLDLAETLDIPNSRDTALTTLTELVTREPDQAFRSEVLARLAGELEFYGDRAADFDFAKKTKNLQAVFANGADAKKFKSTKEETVNRLEVEWKARRGSLIALEKREAARRQLFLPLVSRTVRSNGIMTQDLVSGGAR